jgi:hypothetical protein
MTENNTRQSDGTQPDFSALREVFDPEEIEWRIQLAGETNGRIWAIAVPYVTNRAIQSRLDEVVGPASWKNYFKQGPDGGVLCGISLRIDGEWVTKWDGAENTDIESVKGGLSSSMKRAAVQWGIGRYLYALEETFANVHEGGRFRGKTKDGKPFKWDPPQLPAWALPRKKRARGSATKAAGFEQLRREHDALLEFIKTVGARADADAQLEVGGQPRNLKDYVRENWSDIKEQIGLARTVVEALEAHTGIKFNREAA